ncbi:MAG: GNAT family N-acetyltransferase [Bacteroidetes bacterium]|nr:GNAT family N-acetyltransferase [Bacteroidota bacterium]
MQITKVKSFDELTKKELYQILRLRSEIFVVEQNCVYQDIDNFDQKALHLFIVINDVVIAYTRLFNAGDYYNEASIGRVVVDKNHRNNNLGHLIIEKSKEAIVSHFNKSVIVVSAQLYLKDFYASHNFIQKGEGYLEDGIPHIKMFYNK